MDKVRNRELKRTRTLLGFIGEFEGPFGRRVLVQLHQVRQMSTNGTGQFDAPARFTRKVGRAHLRPPFGYFCLALVQKKHLWGPGWDSNKVAAL